MSTSTSSSRSPAIASSSIHTPASSSPGSAQHGARRRGVEVEDAAEEDDDAHGLDIGEEELLSSDPMHSVLPTAINRPNSQHAPSLASRFLSSSSSPSKRSNTATPNTILSYLNAASTFTSADPSNPDWATEGFGRRVGYEDLTAIDWIYEYSKERTRVTRLGEASSGLLGQARFIWDASHVWIVLVLTGIAVGGIAAFIDVASDWLGDLKTGICAGRAAGGRWWLNKGFCCWGVEAEECKDWRSWGALLGIGGVGGGFIIEYIAFVLLSVAFATVASTLVNRYALYAKQSGIPEIKTVLGGFVIRRFMGSWVLVVKSLGLCLAVASGMWLGKEGPLVHVACCCANLFMRPFESIAGNEARKRETLSAAAASGISVAFGSPIGGVLFSLEQLSYYFPDKTMWASFVCAMVAAVTLQAFDPFRTGKLVLYQVTYHSGWHAFELVPFAFIGVVGGLYGAMFIKLNMLIARWRSSPAKRTFLSTHPVLEVAIVALATALISFPITFLRAQTSELVEYLFAECIDITSDPLNLCRSGTANTGVIFILLISSLLGFILTSLTFGLQIPAGILLPSMAIGALFGRSIGLITEVWQREHPNWLPFATCEPDVPCVTPGTYAVIGAAATLAGATRMTVSIVVIMFELTGALTDVLPIMIAVMISKWVGDAFGTRGIYESWIHHAGYPFLENKDDGAVPDIDVSRIMTRYEDLVCLPSTGHTIASLQKLLRSHPFRGYPVIASPQDPILLGYISHPELSYALTSATSPTGSRSLPPEALAFFIHQPLADASVTLDLRPWMDQTPITLSSRASLQICNALFQKLGLRNVLFTAKGGRLAGIMSKKDLWGVLNEDGEVLEPGTHEGRGEGGRLREEREGHEDERGLLGDEDGVGGRRGSVG